MESLTQITALRKSEVAQWSTPKPQVVAGQTWPGPNPPGSQPLKSHVGRAWFLPQYGSPCEVP